MDGSRFDRMTRALATEAPRRRILAGLVLGVLGGFGWGGRANAKPACGPLRRPCTEGEDCCSGFCVDGRCGCAPGNEPCGRDCAPICPPDQYRGSGCRCLCRNTGREPGPVGCPCSESSVCDFGDIVFCGGTQNDCLCDATTGGELVCSDFFAQLEGTCESDADCPPSYSCVTSFDCAQPFCALNCGGGGFSIQSSQSRVSPRIRTPESDDSP